MYQPQAAAGRSSPGVSGDGYDGAESFFEQCKTVAGELKIPGLPSGSQESAAAKAALDAYMSARNGFASVNEAFFHQGQVPSDFPHLNLKGGDATIGSKSGEIGKAVGDMMTHMGDMLNQIMQGPMGILSNVLSFLMKLFGEVATGIGEILTETMHAVAAAVEDTWKKLQLASTASNTGLQPLELYNQAATTQPLATALKNTATT